MKYLLVGDNYKTLYIQNDKGTKAFCFNKKDNKWEDGSYSLFVASTGYDDSEPEGSPYRWGSGSSLQEIKYITKEEAEKFLNKPIDEKELEKLMIK